MQPTKRRKDEYTFDKHGVDQPQPEQAVHINFNNLTLPVGVGQIRVNVNAQIGDEKSESDTPAELKGIPAIGQYWPGQGGIYAGDFLGGDGVIYGLIVSDCGSAQDIGKAPWGQKGSLALSDWDGLRNTSALIAGNHPAAKLAAEYTHDECTDFYLPARRELLLAAANLHDRFGNESWYWTSTPYAGGDSTAQAVDFEHGLTIDRSRFDEFRVRPFRRFIY